MSNFRIPVPAVLLALLLAACARQDGEGAGEPSAAEQPSQIRELEQQQAKLALAGDRDALADLFAPEFRIVNPAGAVVTKAELLEILAGSGPSPYRSASYETQQVAVRGDVAWSLGLETVVFAQDALGSQAGQTVQRRVTHVWERQDGRWRLVLRHTTNVAPP